jgi:hypothetical protein
MSAVTSTSPAALAPDRLIVTPLAPTSPSAAGTLLSYDSGAAGLAVHLSAEVSERAAQQLDGERAWVRANVAGRLVAFQAVTRRSDVTRLDANGITVPLEEHRRRHLRAATRVPVRLAFESEDGTGAVLEATTVDLSRGGCRIELPAPGPALPAVGAVADVRLALPTGAVTATGRLLRVDHGTGEAVLQFTQVPGDGGDEIDRHVLSLLW